MSFGLKKTFGHSFQANLAAFYYNYQNDQIPLAVQPAIGAATTFVFNVPSVHTYGVELETIWRPIDPLTLSVNYAFLSAKIASTGGICFADTNDPQATQPGANTKGCPVAGAGQSQGQNTTGETISAGGAQQGVGQRPVQDQLRARVAHSVGQLHLEGRGVLQHLQQALQLRLALFPGEPARDLDRCEEPLHRDRLRR